MMYLLGLNVLCNPVIYFTTNKRFRKTVVDTVGLSEIRGRDSGSGKEHHTGKSEHQAGFSKVVANPAKTRQSVPNVTHS